ncbi:D-ribose pyranase [Alicyclobacillus tolerans]|uniref:D-ribose pyranase n=1 Tax=Alicyclobacillus tolerans TaxID=90970 RepID=UPI001F025F6D|nr:D-ribose pyranase [Alicyclobacillus tolerans]MCF8567346.1 D-ribose pyranase [Alicyclobacillus tolerans]
MKNTNGILNSKISRVIAEVGHTDLLLISDAGLPIPQSVERIDVAIVPNIPRFLDVLKAILSELSVERIVLAEEIKSVNPRFNEEILSLFPSNIEVTYVSHTDFKRTTQCARVAIRTGEFTPYANIILQAGVVF